MELKSLLIVFLSTRQKHEVICFNLDNLPCQLQSLDETKYESCACTRSSLVVLVYYDQCSQSV